MSRLEEVWRGWQALNMHDRARFLHLFREAYRQEREERLVANRRAAGEPVTASDFDRMKRQDTSCDALQQPNLDPNRIASQSKSLCWQAGLTSRMQRSSGSLRLSSSATP